MPKSGKSLISAMIFDGQGGASKVGWNEIKAWDSSKGVLWVHLNLNEKRTHTWLLRKSRLEKIHVLALTAEEVRPRTVFVNNGVLIVLRGINHNPGAEPEDMVSIRIWLEESRIITTSLRKLTSIDDMIHSLKDKNGPKSPADFIVMLNDFMNDHISESVEELEGDIVQLEEDIMTAKSHDLRSKISEIRRQAVMIRRYLSPQRDALYRLYNEPSKLFDENHRQQLRETTDRVIRYNEDLDSFRDRATITHEELVSRLSEKLEKRMSILSVIAVIFSPLTFITGLFGMNVGGIPGSGSIWGFLIASTIISVIGLCVIIYFKNTKWL